MYGRKSDEILKEVDSFIAQAKLEGDISGSSSSNLSLFAKEKEECKLEESTVNKYQSEITSEKSLFLSDKNDNENIKTYESNKDILNAYNHNPNNYKIPNKKDIEQNEEINNIISDRSQNIDTSKCQSNLPNYASSKNDCRKANMNQSNNNEKDSCDSSFIDLGNEGRSNMPYVMWLQEKRSKRRFLNKSDEDIQTKKKFNQRDEVHIHEVNSALFWERWIDKIFDIYDQWVQSSDSEDGNAESENMQFSKEYPNKNLPTRIKSEPILRGGTNEVSNLKYKCPSYVDWLVRRRQAKNESSDSEEVFEEKKNDNYWSSLYGKLTKSLSSIFLSPKAIKEGKEFEDEAEATPLVNKPQSECPSDLVKDTSKGLRRSHSISCSYHRHSANSANKLRHRQLNQDAVGSPVLTDQLVELVCNTLSPESSEESSSQEDYKRNKLNRRNTKRRS